MFKFVLFVIKKVGSLNKRLCISQLGAMIQELIQLKSTKKLGYLSEKNGFQDEALGKWLPTNNSYINFTTNLKCLGDIGWRWKEFS